MVSSPLLWDSFLALGELLQVTRGTHGWLLKRRGLECFTGLSQATIYTLETSCTEKSTALNRADCVQQQLSPIVSASRVLFPGKSMSVGTCYLFSTLVD